MKTRFDTLLEKVYNTLDRRGNAVQYVAPDDNEQYIDAILKFIESDTNLLTTVMNLNNSETTTHQNIVDFWNSVISKANDVQALQDTPPQVWQDLRDWAFSRVGPNDPNHDVANSPAWQGGPSVLQAFDDNMKVRGPEYRVPFSVVLKQYQKKGLGLDHLFSRQKAEADQAKTGQPATSTSIQGLNPATS
jgi:23S rRNA G2069 N7-methylase RlmK/C1962 C5-methylase RlmI